MATAAAGDRVRTVRASVNYAIDTGKIESFHANDHSLDTVRLDPRVVEITDARTLAAPPVLDINGVELFEMPSAVTDWRNDGQVQATYPEEIKRFIRELTGADAVAVMGPCILRWSERSPERGSRNGSDAARLIHSDATFAASDAAARGVNPFPERAVRRVAHHNVWRAFSGPPIDVPLAVCDSATVPETDIVEASADFDVDGVITWRLPSMTFRHDPAHRWLFFSDMTPDEVLVFKRHDSDATKARYAPHTAFTDPSVDASATPRASVEIRTVSYWYE